MMADAGNSVYDVVVVGAGNAALCAALGALKKGARTLILERGAEAERGGNSFFTDGAMRFAHNGIADIRQIIPTMDETEAAKVVIDAYTAATYADDMRRVNNNENDPELVACLTGNSFNTMRWLAQCGVKFELIYDNQAFQKDGKYHFWGALTVRTVQRGIGGVNMLFELVQKLGGRVQYNTRAVDLRLEQRNGRNLVGGVVTEDGQTIKANAVVLACGGFEANVEQRAKYLGDIWRNAIVRGTACNTGDGIWMALRAGARRYGNWGGCHAISTDFNALASGDRSVAGDIFKKHSYPLGIMVNRDGRRFVDEGADYRNYTYAHYGAAVLRQPGNMAYQIFDARTHQYLRSEYLEPRATVHQADSLPALADGMDIDKAAFLKTVDEYNADISAAVFNPHIKDGKAARAANPPKSNWALPLDTPPFYAFPIKCGLTFTFGGLKIDKQARVLDEADAPIEGLYAAGELVGGLFTQKYPGGSGLMSGAVFGKLAGESAAAKNNL